MVIYMHTSMKINEYGKIFTSHVPTWSETSILIKQYHVTWAFYVKNYLKVMSVLNRAQLGVDLSTNQFNFFNEMAEKFSN
jgi:hypothetical protein